MRDEEDPKSQVTSQANSIVAETPNSILLETSRPDAGSQRSFLFLDPVRTLTAFRLDEIPELFRQVEEALDAGFHVAGFVSYECGYHFQPFSRITLAPSEMPLIWFGVYRKPLNPNVIVSDFPLSSLEVTPFLTIAEDEYCGRVDRIKRYIEAGDTYQVNFTDSVQVRTTSSAADIFASLSHNQPVAYSAFLNVAGHQIISCSPELFFRIEQGRITTRPMKGTTRRGLDSAEDLQHAAWLQNDEKNRAEHVMIVDLLRNDMGRLCTMGSIHVEDMFTIEKYRTLFQMTSTISGTLQSGLTYYDIFKSMFPSGSITGAPKFRTMQIIRELEQRPRGVYTGTIGFIAPDRSCVFNVAIRTLLLKDGHAHMGVGGGIVADSVPAEEYKECLLKTSFLHRSRFDFQIIETMLWDRNFVLLSLHLDRMQSSAAYFEFPFDRAAIMATLAARSSQFLPGELQRVRLLLDSDGTLSITATPYTRGRSIGCVRISPERTASGDIYLRHKTTHREQYDRLYREARADGFDEVLFLNEKDEVTEGAISNIFIQRGDRLFTPPLSSGALPGVYRRHLLQTNQTAAEQVLTLQDLASAEAVFLCNSVRGMYQVRLCNSFETLPGGS
jgi:para-aminobenzoate synthetase/4-amino-4-deoxychorismate lyase